MFDRNLKEYVPLVYRKVTEMDAIMDAEQPIMSDYQAEMELAFTRTFILTADLAGIELFETMFSIIADPATEDIEFRRERLLNRSSMSPPFTWRYLMWEKFNKILGPGKWNAYIDFDNYTIYFEAMSVNQNWYQELSFTVNSIKPCNMVFVNVPVTQDTIAISEEVSYTTLVWNYRLGAWQLGRYPFATIHGADVSSWNYGLSNWLLGHESFATREGGKVIKMASESSLRPDLIFDVSDFVLSDIDHVRINGEIDITEFKTRTSIGDTITLEYYVTPRMTNVIEMIELMRADGTVLTSASVYVPVIQTVISKHLIKTKEGQ